MCWLIWAFFGRTYQKVRFLTIAAAQVITLSFILVILSSCKITAISFSHTWWQRTSRRQFHETLSLSLSLSLSNTHTHTHTHARTHARAHTRTHTHTHTVVTISENRFRWPFEILKSRISCIILDDNKSLDGNQPKYFLVPIWIILLYWNFHYYTDMIELAGSGVGFRVLWNFSATKAPTYSFFNLGQYNHRFFDKVG